MKRLSKFSYALLSVIIASLFVAQIPQNVFGVASVGQKDNLVNEVCNGKYSGASDALNSLDFQGIYTKGRYYSTEPFVGVVLESVSYYNPETGLDEATATQYGFNKGMREADAIGYCRAFLQAYLIDNSVSMSVVNPGDYKDPGYEGDAPTGAQINRIQEHAKWWADASHHDGDQRSEPFIIDYCGAGIEYDRKTDERPIESEPDPGGFQYTLTQTTIARQHECIYEDGASLVNPYCYTISQETNNVSISTYIGGCYATIDESISAMNAAFNDAGPLLPTPGSDSNSNSKSNSCENVEGLFMSWVICPALTAFENFINFLIEIITGGLRWEVWDGLRDVWDNFLPIANVLLAIVFLIMIYSTATGVGLSNYEIKKIMPRLIAVAIGINISYYICAAIADVSNIAANGVGDLINPGNNIPSVNIFSALALTIGMVLAIIFAFAPIALALLTIFVAIAARHLILALLVIVSPVAIALALLPNTKKWFEKWLNTYVQLIVVYPLFMAAWAGIQFVRRNLGSLGYDSFLAWLLDALLLIAPLFLILPLLKMSGGIMGKMTGAIEKGVNNNPVAEGLKKMNKRQNQNRLENWSRLGSSRSANNPTDAMRNATEDYARQEAAIADRLNMRANDIRSLSGSGLTQEQQDARDELNKLDKTYYGENAAGLANTRPIVDQGIIGQAMRIDAENEDANRTAETWNSAGLLGRRRMNNEERRLNRQRQRNAPNVNRGQSSLTTRALGLAARTVSGENDEVAQKRSDEYVKSGRDERFAQSQLDATQGVNTRSSTVDRVQSAQASQLSQQAIEQQTKNVIDQEKLSGGRLAATQSQLNAVTRQGEAVAATIKAEAAEQQLGDVQTMDQMRQAENRTAAATASVDSAKNLTQEAEIMGGTGTATAKIQSEAVKQATDLEVQNVTAAQSIDGSTSDTQRIINAQTDQATVLKNRQDAAATVQRVASGRNIEIERSNLEKTVADDESQMDVNRQKAAGGVLEGQVVDAQRAAAEKGLSDQQIKTDEASRVADNVTGLGDINITAAAEAQAQKEHERVSSDAAAAALETNSPLANVGNRMGPIRAADTAGGGRQGGVARAQAAGRTQREKRYIEAVDEAKSYARTTFRGDFNAIETFLNQQNISPEQRQGVAEYYAGLPGGSSALIKYAESSPDRISPLNPNPGPAAEARMRSIYDAIGRTSSIGAKNPRMAAEAERGSPLTDAEAKLTYNEPKVKDATAWQRAAAEDAIRVGAVGLTPEFIQKVLQSPDSTNMDTSTRKVWERELENAGWSRQPDGNWSP